MGVVRFSVSVPEELLEGVWQDHHECLDEIVSSVHVHMDEHNCLEVVIVRGKAGRIKEIADRLLSLKGVKHGKLVMTGTGKGLV